MFFDVAYQSYLPALVGREHLVEGNAKLTGSAQVAAVAGPSVAGGLVQAIGSSAAVALDSVSFLASAVAVGAIRRPEPKPVVPEEGHPKLVHDIGEGLRFVFGDRLLRAIAATTATSNLFSGIAAAIEIVFLVRAVHASSGVIGLLFTVGGAGGVLGALAAAPIGAALRRSTGHDDRHRLQRRRALDPADHARRQGCSISEQACSSSPSRPSSTT